MLFIKRLQTLKKETLAKFGITTPSVHVGKIASGDEFVASTERTDMLGRDIKGLLCVEMEGAAVAHVCDDYSKPFVVFRTISDKADHSAHIDFPAFLTTIAKTYSEEIIGEFYRLQFRR